VRGARLSQVSLVTLRFARRMMTAFSRIYAETTVKVAIVGLPTALRLPLSSVLEVLPPRVRSKVSILGDDYVECLARELDDEAIRLLAAHPDELGRHRGVRADGPLAAMHMGYRATRLGREEQRATPLVTKQRQELGTNWWTSCCTHALDALSGCLGACSLRLCDNSDTRWFVRQSRTQPSASRAFGPMHTPHAHPDCATPRLRLDYLSGFRALVRARPSTTAPTTTPSGASGQTDTEYHTEVR
jgi:hypothetical protein